MKNICVDERELIRRAKTGDTEAFAALLGLHERFVYNLALRTLNNADDAADIAQDAFVRAWMALHEFREQAQFRTWLYRIVLNLCINRLPRLRRELQNLTHEELIDIPETVYVAADPPMQFQPVKNKLPLKRREFSVQAIAIRMNNDWSQPNH